jgi:hypothetical protein
MLCKAKHYVFIRLLTAGLFKRKMVRMRNGFRVCIFLRGGPIISYMVRARFEGFRPEDVMGKYYIKGPQDRVEHFEIIGDTADCYLVRLTRIVDGDQRILEERISHDLFEICLKTGYIYEMADASKKDVLTKVA